MKKNDALDKPNSIVLTQKLSSKLFNNANPIGKKVIFRNNSFTVTGVIKDIPKNSSFTSNCIISFKTLSQNPDHFSNDWSEWSFRIFCKLNKQSEYKDICKKIANIDEVVDNIFYEEELKEKYKLIKLRPFHEIHFTNSPNFKTVNKKVLNILNLLAIILAIMGIVNFVNLSTAQAIQKAKEIIEFRKVIERKLDITLAWWENYEARLKEIEALWDVDTNLGENKKKLDAKMNKIGDMETLLKKEETKHLNILVKHRKDIDW